MKSFWIFFFASICSLFGSNFLIFGQGQYAYQLTGERLSVGEAWLLFFLPSVLVLPIIGRIFDRLPLKRVLLGIEILKLLAFVAFSVILLYSPTLLALKTLVVIYGVLFAPYFPSVYITVTRLVGSSERAKYSYLSELALQIANAVSLLTLAAFYDVIGFANFMIAATFCVGLGLIVLARMPEQPMQSGLRWSDLRESYLSLAILIKGLVSGRTRGSVRLFDLGHLFFHSIVMASNIPATLYCYEILKSGAVGLGIAGGIVSAMGIVAGLIWTRFDRPQHRTRLLVLSSLMTLVSFALLFWFKDAGFFTYLIFVPYGFFLISNKILARAIVVDRLDSATVGQYATLFQVVGNGCMLLLFFIMSQATLNALQGYLLLGVLAFAYASYGLTVAPRKAAG